MKQQTLDLFILSEQLLLGLQKFIIVQHGSVQLCLALLKG